MSDRLRIRTIFVYMLIMLMDMALASCGGGDGSGLINRHPALEVVERYYAAFSASDNNALMDTVAPDDRNKTGMGILSLVNNLSLSLGGLGLDLGGLASATVQDLKVSMVSENGDRAVVRAEGLFRNTAMAIEAPMCDMLDVQRADDGNWYVDLDAPERMDRMSRIQVTQQEKLMELLNSGDASAGIFGDTAKVLAIYMNMCE